MEYHNNANFAYFDSLFQGFNEIQKLKTLVWDLASPKLSIVYHEKAMSPSL